MAIYKKGPGYDAVIPFLKDILESNGVTVLFSNTHTLVFTSPVRTGSKVIKVSRGHTQAPFRVSYGTSHTSDGSITDEKITSNSASYQHTWSSYIIVANDFIIIGFTGEGDDVRTYSIFGKTDTNMFVVLSHHPNNQNAAFGYDTSNNELVSCVTLNGTYFGPNSKLFRQPIMLMKSDVVIFNGEVPSTINGLYTVSFDKGNSNSDIVSATGWFSPPSHVGSGRQHRSCFYVPL